MRPSVRGIKAKAKNILGRVRRKQATADVHNTASSSLTPKKDGDSSPAQPGKTDRGTEKDTPDSGPEMTPGQPTRSNGKAGQSTASQQISGTQSVDTDGNIPPVRAEGKLDLWKEALDKLPEEQRRSLSSIVTSGEPGATVPQDTTASTISVLLAAARSRQKECEQHSWRFKLVPGSADGTTLGDLTDQVIAWLTDAGNIGMQFAPTIAQQVWPCVKAILNIPVQEAEQLAALLSVVDKVARVTMRGRVYERSFLKDSGLSEDVLKALREALVALYKASLELLAKAIDLLEKNSFQKIVHSILHPDAIKKEAGSDFSDLESRLSQCVEMASAENNKNLQIQVQKLLESTDEKQERKVYKWISPVLVLDHHRLVAEKRAHGTCEWLKDHTEFQDWKASSGCSLLLLQGLSGAGKTFLTSKVIDDISDRGKLLESGPQTEALAFFYFSRNDDSRNSGLACLRSLVRQLFARASCPGKIHSSMKALYNDCESKGQSLSRELCEAQLVDSMNLFSRVTIVLDALDECNEDDRMEFITTLTTLMGNSSRPLLLFISSRPDEQIRQAFCGQAILEVSMEDNNDDIANFILGEINSPDKTKRWGRIDETLRDRVVSELIKKSQGMFRWAALQIHELLKLSSPDEVEERLGRLPRDLEETYDDIYKRQVTERSEFATRVANRAIMWLMAASEPLTSGQLLSAVRINPVKYVNTMARIPNHLSDSGHVFLDSEHADYIDVHDEVDGEQLLEICANFLTLNPEDDLWELAHTSVAEYFEKYYFSRVEAAKYVGTACLVIVMDFYRSVTARRPLGAAMCLRIWNTTQNPEESLSSTAEFGHSPLVWHELIEFAFMRWGRHMAVFDRSLDHNSPDTRPERPWSETTLLAPDGVADLLRKFLGHPNNSSPIHRFWLTTCILQDDGPKYQRKYQKYYKKEYASFTMVIYGLFHLLQSWWEAPPAPESGEHIQSHPGEDQATWIDTRVRSKEGWTLLHMACGVGHHGIFKALVSLGADPKSQCNGRTPLSFACEQNREEHLLIIKTLINDVGCDPNLPRGVGNPLYRAAHYGNTEVLSALLSARADPNRPIERKKSKADELDDSWLPGSPLAAAAAGNHVEALRVLIEEGHADPNMVFPGWFGTAAMQAAFELRLEALEYLIRKAHVDPNAPAPGRGALTTVAITAFARTETARNKTKVFRRLVEIGIDFASFREAGGLKYLSETCFHDTQLRDAAEEGSLELIKILVEECGIDVNYQTNRGEYECALMAALSRCSPQPNSNDSAYLSIIQYLLEKGADVNVHNRGSPLVLAASLGRTDLMELLFEHGAAVDLQEQRKHGSALAAAVSSRQGDAVRWLLEHSADVNLVLNHGWYGSAMIAAISSGDMEMVQLVCYSKADVNLQTRMGDCGSALAFAAAHGYKEAAVCLLKHGAKVNLDLRYGAFRCALMAAVWAGEEDMVGFLLDHEADVNFRVDCDDHTSGNTLDRLAQYDSEVDTKTSTALLLDNAKSALMVAACGGDKELASLLIARGADVTRQENQGWEAVLAAAREYGRARGCEERTIVPNGNIFNGGCEYYGSGRLTEDCLPE